MGTGPHRELDPLGKLEPLRKLGPLRKLEPLRKLDMYHLQMDSPPKVDPPKVDPLSEVDPPRRPNSLGKMNTPRDEPYLGTRFLELDPSGNWSLPRSHHPFGN